MTLALDTGTNTGWAIRIGSVVHSGVQNFQHDAKRESPGMRFLRFSAWLRRMVQEHAVTTVIYEQPHQRGGAATTVGVGLVTHLMSVCADLGVEHVAVHSGTLKKHVTGKGNADKSEMIKAAASIAGRDVTDDNEADAIHLLAYGEATL
jgi:crossover junction endodeoxyribonuclease RuvC